MARKLRKNVTTARYVDGRAVGGSQTFGPDYPGDLPDWAREQLSGLDVWDEPVKEEDDEKPLYEMRKAELVALAQEMGLDSTGNMDDLKDRIEDAREG